MIWKNKDHKYSPSREIRDKLRKMLKFKSTIDFHGTKKEQKDFYKKIEQLQERLDAL